MSETQTTPPEATEERRRPARKRILLLSIIAAVAVLIGAVGVPFYLHAISHESTDDAFLEAHITNISPRVPGHISAVHVEDNQQVKEGDVLAELDSRDYEVALDVAQAKLESAKAAVSEVKAVASAARNILQEKKANFESELAGLEQVRAEVAEMKAGHERDSNDLDRMRQIVQAGAVSRQEYDHAKAQEAMARAKLNSSEQLVQTQAAKIAEAKAAVFTAEDELHQAQAQMNARAAQLQEAEAQVEQAKLDLSYTRIVAPCSGYITKKSVEQGAYIQAGQNLFSIVSPELWVVANYKETQITHIRPGQQVEISVDTYPDVTFTGHVDSIQRGTGSRFSLLPPENAAGNFIKVVQRIPVKIVFDDNKTLQQYVLAPGMSVIPSVDISRQPGAVAGNTGNSSVVSLRP